MIVGNDILTRGLVVGGTPQNLKNSTYDLTVGEIIPIGKDAMRARIRARARGEHPPGTHYLEPREMVWVLSAEEFRMPNNVTGLATLRTTFTKQGILALNVGIIDPFFQGPISTALINFSDRARAIQVGDKFFRVAFFDHGDVTAFHHANENLVRDAYRRDLENVSYSDFAPSFLNIPAYDDEFYEKKLWGILYGGIVKNKWVSFPLIAIAILVFIFLFHLGFWTFILDYFAWFGELIKKLKFWS
jgi:deoxycytidine triphosphate deaminase